MRMGFVYIYGLVFQKKSWIYSIRHSRSASSARMWQKCCGWFMQPYYSVRAETWLSWYPHCVATIAGLLPGRHLLE